MSDRLFALRLFARVARTGSFSRAARELGVSQPSASRIAAELEREVGAALMTRTTRGLTLTEAGTDYLARIEPILAALEEADHAARGTGELRGSLRVALTLGFGVREVIPLLPAFMQLHPALRIDLLMNDRHQNLVTEGVDVALRFGDAGGFECRGAPAGRFPRLLVASPAYLALAGSPDAPESLANHEVIVGPLGIGLESCTFQRDGHTTSVRVEGRLTTSVNRPPLLRPSPALASLQWPFGTAVRSSPAARSCRCLADWQMDPIELHAVFAAGRAAKPSARAFADYLATALRELPSLSRIKT